MVGPRVPVTATLRSRRHARGNAGTTEKRSATASVDEWQSTSCRSGIQLYGFAACRRERMLQ